MLLGVTKSNARATSHLRDAARRRHAETSPATDKFAQGFLKLLWRGVIPCLIITTPPCASTRLARVFVEKAQARYQRYAQDLRGLRDDEQRDSLWRDGVRKGAEHEAPRLGIAAGNEVHPSGFPQLRSEHLARQAAPARLAELRRERAVGAQRLDRRQVIVPARRELARGTPGAQPHIRRFGLRADELDRAARGEPAPELPVLAQPKPLVEAADLAHAVNPDQRAG